MTAPARTATVALRAVGTFGDDLVHATCARFYTAFCGALVADVKLGRRTITCPRCRAEAPNAVTTFNTDSRDSTPVPGAGEAGGPSTGLRARPALTSTTARIPDAWEAGPAPTPDQTCRGEVAAPAPGAAPVGPGAASPVPGPTADKLPDDVELPPCRDFLPALGAAAVRALARLVHDALAPYRRH